MSADLAFKGFTPETISFFLQLSQNNHKAWFDAHRQQYQEAVLNPSRAFVEALGSRLEVIAPAIHADPRINQSIFRINRDVRFSKDKSPYKPYLSMIFWEGQGSKLECSSFYFHVEPPTLLLGAGIYIFPDHILKAYRERSSIPSRALPSSRQSKPSNMPDTTSMENITSGCRAIIPPITSGRNCCCTMA